MWIEEASSADTALPTAMSKSMAADVSRERIESRRLRDVVVVGGVWGTGAEQVRAMGRGGRGLGAAAAAGVVLARLSKAEGKEWPVRVASMVVEDGSWVVVASSAALMLPAIMSAAC